MIEINTPINSNDLVNCEEKINFAFFVEILSKAAN